MKRMARAKTRDRNEPEIVEALRRLGCAVYRMDEPLDLLVGVKLGLWHETILLEVKDGNKAPSDRPLTPSQVEFFRDWLGGRAGVVRCVEEALCFAGLAPCRQQRANYESHFCECGRVEDPSWITAERAEEMARKRNAKKRARCT